MRIDPIGPIRKKEGGRKFNYEQIGRYLAIAFVSAVVYYFFFKLVFF